MDQDSTQSTEDARMIGQLVAERPATARVFERFGIDYCCHGQRSVDDASRSAGLDPSTVQAALAAVEDSEPDEVDGLDPDALVDHIVSTHHNYLHEELPLLHALATKVRDVHGGRHPELAQVAGLVAAIRADLEPHLAKEEQILFPAIKEATAGEADFPFGAIGNPIRMMMLEHERAGDLLEQLRKLTNDFTVPDDGCASYHSLYQRLEALEADTHRHVHLENNVLFPSVVST